MNILAKNFLSPLKYEQRQLLLNTVLYISLNWLSIVFYEVIIMCIKTHKIRYNSVTYYGILN